MVERCALSGSDLKIKFRTILLTSIFDIIQQVRDTGIHLKVLIELL